MSPFVRSVAFSLALTTLMTACEGEFAPPEPQTDPTGEVQSKIVGGTTETGFPAVGALMIFNPSQGLFGMFCTGTLIHPKWVLTAAHCIDGDEPFPLTSDPESVFFFIGSDTQVPSPIFFPSNTQFIATEEHFIHPSYTSTGGNDIALMRLAEPVVGVEPIPVFDGSLTFGGFVGEEVTYVGFGDSNGLTESGSGIKRLGAMDVVGLQSLLYFSEFNGQGVCFGDSGGPGLLTGNDGIQRVVGVNSFVQPSSSIPDPCQNVAGHVRVDKKITWIENTVDDACLDPSACDDANPCTADSCLFPGTCINSPIAGACDDGDDCTLGDQCSGGVCAPGPPIDCDDGELCTEDFCVNGGDCTSLPNDEPCDDGNDCTTGDQCGGGSCQPGTAADCDDGQSCTTDTCNPAIGCVHTVDENACATVCEVSGPALSTATCSLRLARGTLGMPTPASFQMDFAYNAAVLSAAAFRDEVCLAPGLCFPQQVPPAALSTGHTISLEPGAVSNWNGTGRLLAANLSDPSAAITEAYLDSTGVVGEPEFVTFEFTLLETIPGTNPEPILVTDLVASTANALGMSAVVEDETIIVNLLSCEGVAGACDDGDECTTDTCAGGTTCTHEPISGCGFVGDGEIQLTAVEPNASEPGATRLITLSGQNFPVDAEVFVEGGEVLSVVFLSATSLLAEVAAPATPGTYDVSVFVGLEFDTLVDAFVVTEAFCDGVTCGSCSADVDCVEGDACTQDTCIGGQCVHDLTTTECCAGGDCAACSLAGDLTGDGAISLTDVQCSILLSLWTLSNKDGPTPVCLGNPLSAADINCDSDITVADVSLVVTVTLELPIDPELDPNGNGCVDACEGL